MKKNIFENVKQKGQRNSVPNGKRWDSKDCAIPIAQ